MQAYTDDVCGKLGLSRQSQLWDKKNMARRLGEGERPLDWVGSSKKDFLAFPASVKDAMGAALGVAQFGGKHPSAKPWKGQGPGVLEIAQQDYEARNGQPKP